MAMIDEFNHMSDEDKSAMHEAMEAQEIHVAKAGIIATFKANTAILAAANPKYGRFDISDENLIDQFNIPPTIMSRFDLIFPVRDIMDQKKDTEMAEHILTSHYTAGVRAAGQKHDISELEKMAKPPIDPDLLRKYIAYSRKVIKPVLSEEASNKIRDFYLELRRIGEKQGTVAITPRYLEGLVRLAEASAKARLSPTVDLVDSDRSIKLMKHCLKEVGIDPETGRLDIDRLVTGQAKSRTDKIRAILRIIKKLTSQFEEARHEAILEEATSHGIKPDELDSLLNELKRVGDVYTPKYGIYKPATER
jgi:replicative DNA helicase Mcm